MSGCAAWLISKSKLVVPPSLLRIQARYIWKLPARAPLWMTWLPTANWPMSALLFGIDPLPIWTSTSFSFDPWVNELSSDPVGWSTPTLNVPPEATRLAQSTVPGAVGSSMMLPSPPSKTAPESVADAFFVITVAPTRSPRAARTVARLCSRIITPDSLHNDRRMDFNHRPLHTSSDDGVCLPLRHGSGRIARHVAVRFTELAHHSDASASPVGEPTEQRLPPGDLPPAAGP